jgi:phosphate-selective porin OprO/OprP
MKRLRVVALLVLTEACCLLSPASAQGRLERPDARAEKPRKRPSLRIGRTVRLDFTARIEADLRGATPAIGRDTRRFEWRDRRVGVEGTAFDRVDFELSRELGEDFETSVGLRETTAWRDAYIDARVTNAFRVQAGRFKLPFGHEELIGKPNLDFANRSFAARVLSPSRDVGVMAHGRLFARWVEYQVGYFTRDGSNGRTSQTGGGHNARVARLVMTPFAARGRVPVLERLSVGAAVARSDLDDRLGVRGRTVLGDGIFFDRLYVNGRRVRVGWEVAWSLGPLGFSSERVTLSDQRKGMGFSGEDLPSIDATAWYLAGTWTVTGERKDGRVEPRRDLLNGGIGAVELAVRVEALEFGATTYPTADLGYPSPSTLVGNVDHAVTIGINWYLNHYVKVQANVIAEAIADPARSPAPASDGRFTSVIVRLQFRL